MDASKLFWPAIGIAIVLLILASDKDDQQLSGWEDEYRDAPTSWLKAERSRLKKGKTVSEGETVRAEKYEALNSILRDRGFKN